MSACSSEKLRDRFQLPLVQLVADFGNFCNMVESTLDLEALAQENAFRLRPSFDERLKVVAKERNKKKKKEREKERFSFKFFLIGSSHCACRSDEIAQG